MNCNSLVYWSDIISIRSNGVQRSTYRTVKEAFSNSGPVKPARLVFILKNNKREILKDNFIHYTYQFQKGEKLKIKNELILLGSNWMFSNYATTNKLS